MLSALQRKLLDRLEEAERTSGICPTFTELAAHCGCDNKAIGRMINQLARRGYIRRYKGSDLQIDIVHDRHMSDEAAELLRQVLQSSAINLVEGSFPGWSRRTKTFLHRQQAAAPKPNQPRVISRVQ